MKLKELLKQRRPAIIDRWLDLIIKTYPADAARFLGRESNRFSNPVGHTFAREIETLFDAVVGEADTRAVNSSLDEINKIRAVQDHTASRAVAYIFFLKSAIREEVGEITDGRTADELLSLESRIDGMALLAFESYMRCREKLFEIKCDDIRRRASLLGIVDNRNTNHRYKV